MPNASGPAHQAPNAVRRVAIVAFPDVQILDVTGPMEVFSLASRLLDLEDAPGVRYRVDLLGLTPEPIRASCGLELLPHGTIHEASGAFDTLLVAGGLGSRAAAEDEALRTWLRAQAPGVRRLGSVCTGAFVLAAAGLLNGRRATTHWFSCEALAHSHPAITVERDPIFVRDGNVYTSAGVTAGIDLALALVEEDLGREWALSVARWLVMFLKRPGGQSQFSAQLAAQEAEHAPLRAVQAWIADHVDADLSVEALAARASMSPRNFARVFAREVGTTPARYVERVRVETARRRLEETHDGVDAVAAACGFGSAETMRRAFLRTVHVNPVAYRHRFRSAEPAA